MICRVHPCLILLKLAVLLYKELSCFFLTFFSLVERFLSLRFLNNLEELSKNVSGRKCLYFQNTKHFIHAFILIELQGNGFYPSCKLTSQHASILWKLTRNMKSSESVTNNCIIHSTANTRNAEAWKFPLPPSPSRLHIESN